MKVFVEKILHATIGRFLCYIAGYHQWWFDVRYAQRSRSSRKVYRYCDVCRRRQTRTNGEWRTSNRHKKW